MSDRELARDELAAIRFFVSSASIGTDEVLANINAEFEAMADIDQLCRDLEKALVVAKSLRKRAKSL